MNVPQMNYRALDHFKYFNSLDFKFKDPCDAAGCSWMSVLAVSLSCSLLQESKSCEQQPSTSHTQVLRVCD